MLFKRTVFGFTLLEVLIVVAVLGVLSALSAPLLTNLVRNNDLNTASQGVIYDLRRARSFAMSGENGLKWGIRFNNTLSGDYYQIFSSPTDFSSASTTVDATIYLPGQIRFSDPAEATVKDIIFERISGSVLSPATLTITDPGNGSNAVININSSGNVY